MYHEGALCRETKTAMLLPCLSDIRDKGFYACYAACSSAQLFGAAASGLTLAAHHEGAWSQTKTAMSLSCLSDVRYKGFFAYCSAACSGMYPLRAVAFGMALASQHKGMCRKKNSDVAAGLTGP